MIINRNTHHRGLAAALSIAFLATATSFGQDAAPKPLKTYAPLLSYEQAPIEGTIEAVAHVNRYGYVTRTEINAAPDPETEAAIDHALRRWVFEPALKDGKPIAAKVVQPFFFSQAAPAATPAPRQDSHPSPVVRTAPELPENLANLSGRVTLRASIAADGKVIGAAIDESTHEELNSYVLEAIHHWRFRPAIRQGEKVSSTVVIPFNFNSFRDEKLVAAETKQPDRVPRIKRAEEPELPEALKGVGGYVHVLFELDAQGNVVRATTRKSSLESLEGPTLEAAQNWKFRPAVEDGHAVSSSVLVPINFNEKG